MTFIALERLTAKVQGGPVGGHQPFGLPNPRGVIARIDQKQRLAVGHHGAIDDQRLLQQTRDLRHDVHAGVILGRAEADDFDGRVDGDDRGEADGRGRHLGRSAFCFSAG